MRQQNSLGADISRDSVPKMAAIVPQVQASPKSNGNPVDSSEIPDTAKSNKVVRVYSSCCFWFSNTVSGYFQTIPNAF